LTDPGAGASVEEVVQAFRRLAGSGPGATRLAAQLLRDVADFAAARP
jgi:hypothetical protein